MFTVTKLTHANGNDTNGNPRRLFLIQEIDGSLGRRVEVIDEYPQGNYAWQKKYPNAVWMGEWELAPRQWQVFKRMVGVPQ